jgi:CheY-like chemotaxis protein
VVNHERFYRAREVTNKKIQYRQVNRMKNQILYVEDDEFISYGAKSDLRKGFPKYKIIIAETSQSIDRLFKNNSCSLEELAMVCTDGHIGGMKTGWDVLEELRKKGYTGPAIYTGSSKLPKEKRDLYSEIGVPKIGDELINAIKRYIGAQPVEYHKTEMKG